MFISIAITAFTPFSVFYLLNRILQTIAKKKLDQNWRHSVVFIANFEQISNLALIFLSLKLKQVNARWVKG